MHVSSKSLVTYGFFFLRCFPRILLAVSVTAVLKLFVIVSTSSSAKISGPNFPPIIALNCSVMLGSLIYSRSNFILVFFSLLIFILVFFSLLVFILVFFSLLVFILVFFSLLVFILVFFSLLVFILVFFSLLIFILVFFSLLIFILVFFSLLVFFS